MKSLFQLFLVATALAGLITLMLAPATPVLPHNPMAVIGVGLIGLGLVRRAQQSLGGDAAPTDANLGG